MITIKSIRNTNYNDYDEVWAIVRSMKNQSPNIKQVADISPSWDLFKKYRTLADNKQWNKNAFDTIYVPQFLKEMHTQTAINTLNTIYQIDKAGDNLCLVCFCPDETMCHRSIIAGLLQGVGCNVKTESGTDYSYYYKMYKEIY